MTYDLDAVKRAARGYDLMVEIDHWTGTMSNDRITITYGSWDGIVVMDDGRAYYTNMLSPMKTRADRGLMRAICDELDRQDAATSPSPSS